LKPPPYAPVVLRQFSVWMLVYICLWLLLTGANGWAFGLICALAATVLTLWLNLPLPRWRLLHLPAFLGFFLFEMLMGAWDVARRALHPAMPINPVWVTHGFGCADPRVRLALSAMVGLMPGTLCSHIDDDTLHLHVLDQNQAWQLPVQQMETHLARLFGTIPS
jgi:multicomponent Na+:H+ antiporter subunit E